MTGNLTNRRADESGIAPSQPLARREDFLAKEKAYLDITNGLPVMLLQQREEIVIKLICDKMGSRLFARSPQLWIIGESPIK